MNLFIGSFAVLLFLTATGWNMFRGSRQVVVLGSYCDLGLVDRLNKKGWRTIAHVSRIDEVVSLDSSCTRVSAFGCRSVTVSWEGDFLHAGVGKTLEKSERRVFALWLEDMKLVVVTEQVCQDDCPARQLLDLLQRNGVPVVGEDEKAIPYNYGISVGQQRWLRSRHHVA